MNWVNWTFLATRENSPSSCCRLQNLNCPDVRCPRFPFSFSISYYSNIVTDMNLLSGSTRKGAKLSIGEAKLDFPER